MFVQAVVVVAPKLSVAVAVIHCVPNAPATYVAVYGEVASIPAETPPTKNSTCATEPLSEALAAMFTVLPVITLDPFAGAVMLTVGAGLLATVIVIVATLVAPKLSVAVAVIVCEPKTAV